MADTQQPQRSLWLQVVWKPVFRSRREKLVYYSTGSVLALPAILAAVFEWPVRMVIAYTIGSLVLYSAGVLVWLTWGRRAVPGYL